MNWYLGTMGFGWKEWVGPFYPAGMGSRHFLAHYSQFFDAVEVDATFYGIPRETQVAQWKQVTPPDFRLCLKTPRAITHDAPLLRGQGMMQQFVDRVRPLQPKLGPLLIQFGPDFDAFQAKNLDHFLAALPTDLRYAVEFRHASWDQPAVETAALLAQHHVAWASTDYLYMAKVVHRTTDFLYLRFIGRHGRFPTKDRELVDRSDDLRRWQEMLTPHLGEVTAVYGFFNNDYAGYSPATCNRFKQLLGLETTESQPPQQGRLF